MKLTDGSRKLVLPEGKSEAIFFDDDLPGFGIRLRADAPATWVYQFKIGSQHRRKTLGRASAISASAARKEALKLYSKVAVGQDPVAVINENKARAADTFKAAAREFIEWQKTRKRKDGSFGLRPGSLRELERHLGMHARPLHDKQLAKITRADIARCVTAIHRNSGPRAGNSVRSSISALYSWAVKNAKAELNPVIGSPREEQSSRERVLLPSELRAVWTALDDVQYGAIVRLLLLTGLREGEVAGLRWSEIHDDSIVLPGSRTKNRKPHVVPLSQTASAIIERQPRRATEGTVRDLIFGLGQNGFSGWSRSKQRLDARITQASGAPLPHWTLHDLRRTVASYLGGGLPSHLLAKLPPHERKLAEGLKVQPHVIEEVLNHQSGYKAGIVAVYQRGSFEAEKRTALSRWADHLTAIVEGRDSNVMPLRREA